MSDTPERSDASATPVTASVERRIVSVLFADLVGFTTLSERLDAEEMAAVQDAYFGSVRETVDRYGGTLEKFIGDAAMAVFGAPRSRDDDAERAVRAGVALIGAVEQLGARLGLAPGELRLRVGVNSGEVAHATSGPDSGRVTGDTVNTAARLQAAAEPNRVLIGELTALAVREAIELSDAGPMSLKGKAQPVRAWQADGIRPEPSRDAALGSLQAPLLGRARDLARLEAGDEGRVTIVAPPGVGKSRLVAELEARVRGRGARVLRARVPRQPGMPYDAVRQLLVAAGVEERLDDALAGIDESRRDVIRREVRTLLVPSSGDGRAVDASAEREARFGAWLQALEALAGGATWIVEDVHWAGPDLLDFLDTRAREAGRVVATSRPSLLETSPDWIAASDVLELSTLTADDASALVRTLAGEALPAELVTAVAERSDGNPLFIEELLRTWISVGTLVPSDGGWQLAVGPETVSLPATVQAIYAAQLDDLPTDARLVARRASVAGRRFTTAALEPLELGERSGGLEVLRRRAFVAGPVADDLGDESYAYRHALLRDAGYASLARVERARLHAALARWLSETAGDRAADVAQLVAEHFAAAADSVPAIGAGEGLDRPALARQAADWFERAGAAALAMAAPASAVRLLDRSVELTEPTALDDLARRQLRRGEVRAASAELDAAIEDITAAVAHLTTRLPELASVYAEAAYQLGMAYMQQIRFGEAESLTLDALHRLADADERPGVARLMALHAWSVAAQGRDEGVRDEARRAREMGAALGDPALEVDLLEHYAATSDELDAADPAVWDELEERARAAHRWRQVVVALRVRGTFRADTDPRAALPLVEESARLADVHGLTEQRGWADLARAEALFVAGDWDAALQAAEAAIALAERYAYGRLAFRTWMVAWPILAERRDASWAPRFDAWWTAAEPHLPSSPSPYAIVLTAARRIWEARAAGGTYEGELEVPDVIPPYLNPHFLAAREALVQTFLARGQRDVAERLAGGQPEPDWTPLMRASHALTHAWLAWARGESEDARALASEATTHAAAIGARWWLDRARNASA